MNRFAEFLDLKKVKSRKLLHIHIPKTGGTTVNSLFARAPLFFNAEHSCFERGVKVQGKVKINTPGKGKTGEWPCYRDYVTADSLIFGVTRNPFSWLVSYFYHTGAGRFGLKRHVGWQGVRDIYNFQTFDAFVNAYLDMQSWHFPPISKSPIGQLIDINGNFQGDFLLLSETLVVSLPVMAASLNIHLASDLLHLNKSQVSKDYRDFFSDNLAERVFERFPDFFNITGYGFETVFVNSHSPTFIELERGVTVSPYQNILL
jgi:hypothetical protein